jgi:hypothetical protein
MRKFFCHGFARIFTYRSKHSSQAKVSNNLPPCYSRRHAPAAHYSRHRLLFLRKRNLSLLNRGDNVAHSQCDRNDKSCTICLRAQIRHTLSFAPGRCSLGARRLGSFPAPQLGAMVDHADVGIRQRLGCSDNAHRECALRVAGGIQLDGNRNQGGSRSLFGSVSQNHWGIHRTRGQVTLRLVGDGGHGWLRSRRIYGFPRLRHFVLIYP